MQSKFTLSEIRRMTLRTFAVVMLCSLCSVYVSAQQYLNGNLSTGATSSDGTAAPAGFTWSEVQVGNGNAGFSSSITGGFSIADNFTVPAGTPWSVTKITVYAYSTGYTGTTSPFQELRLQIFNTNPSVGTPTPIFGDLTTNRLSSSSSAGMYRIFNATPGNTRKIWKLEALVPVTLNPGSYWMEWQTGVTSALTSNYTPPSTVVGTTTQTGNNAKQHDLTANTWSDVVDATSTDPQDFSFVINYATTPCSGIPELGNTISSGLSVCEGIGFDLSISNSVAGSGVSYQWQSSSDNVTYTNISGANGASYLAIQSAATWYRLIATCSNSSLSDTSTATEVSMNQPTSCYCIPPATDCTLDDVILNVTIDTINNTSDCSSSGYTDYTNDTSVGTATLTAGARTPMSVAVGAGGTEHVSVWIDYNQNGVFDSYEFTSLGNANGDTIRGFINTPTNALAGVTRMRVRLRYSTALTDTAACIGYTFGETEDYRININIPPPCTGTPDPGNTVSSVSSVCPGIEFNLSISNDLNSTASEISYQWQSSSDGINYTDIANANSDALTAILNETSWYQLVATCSGNSATSTPVMITANPWNLCYCIPDSSNCTDDDIITNVAIDAINNNSDCGTNGYTDYTTNDSVATAMLYTNSSNPISVTVGTGGTEYVGAWIDYNHNGLFDSTEFTSLGSGNGVVLNGNIDVPSDAQTGLTRMRVRLRWLTPLVGTSACIGYTFGETEDYNVMIMAPTPCSGTPDAGNTVSSDTNVCPGTMFTLSISNNTNMYSGLTFQWQSSSDGITYSDIAGANASRLNTILSDTTWYQLIVTCSGNSVTSVPVEVFANPWNVCYCTPSTTNCGVDDVILNVTMGSSLNNTTDCTTGGYSNYVNDPTVGTGLLAIGSRIPMSVEVGPGGTEYVGVWVDYDHSGSFDSSEFTALGSANGAIINGAVNVPANALLGETRMRVRVRFNLALTGNDACLGYTYGETEDYKVEILTCVPSQITQQPLAVTSLCGSNAMFTVESTGFSPIYQWQTRANSTLPWTDLVDGGAISGANTDSLKIQPIADAMNGSQFRVSIFYCASTVYSDSVELTVSKISGSADPASAAICKGNVALLSIGGYVPVLPTTVTFESGALGTTIPDDGTTAGINNSINVTGIPAGSVISSVKVKINATHTWVGDLIGTIKAPNGKVLNLAYVLSGTGGTAVTTGLTNTIFASNATASFGNGTDPFSSTYAADAYLPSMAIANDPTNPSFPTTPNDPVQTGPDGYIPDVTNFSDLFSTPNGSWTLGLYDYWADAGSPTQPINTLDDWSIEITYASSAASVGIWSPSTGLYNNASLSNSYNGTLTHSVYASPSATTNYSLVIQTPGCSSDPIAVPVTVYSTPSVSIAASPLTSLYPGLQTTLNSSVTNASTPEVTYQWNYNGAILSNASSASHNVDINGLGNYTLTVTDGHGCKSAVSNVVTIEDSLNYNLFIYPNPNNGIFQIRYNDKYNGVSNPRSVTIYDSKGSRVYNQSFNINKPFGKAEIDMTKFGKGIYFVELTDAAGVRLKSGKVVIQ